MRSPIAIAIVAGLTLAGGSAALAVPDAAAHGPAPAAAAAPAPIPTPNPSDPLAAQLQQAAADQQLLQQTSSSLSSEIDAANAQQVQLVQLIKSNQQQIAQTMQQIAQAEQNYTDAINREAAAKAEEQRALEQEHKDQELLALYLRAAYVDRSDAMSYILSGSSLSDALQRSSTLAHMDESTTELTNQVAQDANTAKKAADAAAADAQAAAKAVNDLNQQQQQLQQQTDNAQQLVYQLSAQAQAATTELQQLNSQDIQLAQQIADMRMQQLDDTIAQAEEADWQAAEFYIQHHLDNFPWANGQPVQSTAPAGNGSTQLIWPAPHTVISQGFGPSPYPMEPAMFGYPHFHTGVDLAGPMGSPIYAAADGIVVASDSGTVGYGNHIILAHANGMLTLYGHLSSSAVQAGQQVHKGDLIGFLGSTGNSTGPHLHFEVRVNNTPVDPFQFLPPLPAGATGPDSTTG